MVGIRTWIRTTAEVVEDECRAQSSFRGYERNRVRNRGLEHFVQGLLWRVAPRGVFSYPASVVISVVKMLFRLVSVCMCETVESM
jgi:hypothetical protein